MTKGRFERSQPKGARPLPRFLRFLLLTAGALISGGLTLSLVLAIGLHSPATHQSAQSGEGNAALMDRYDMHMTNQISSALEGVLSIDKVYWLRDSDQVAPKPDPAKFGETTDPATLQWLLEDAAELLEGQPTLFSTDVQIMPGSKVTYYLDETIFAVTWKQVMDWGVYTVSEVKIAHPSQFRRFLAGGEYGSDKSFLTTEMAQSVNAVVASSGDFYQFRKWGISVYDRQVQRVHGTYAHTCYIDDNGDLHFTRGGEITASDAAQAFVDQNQIRFSLAFGPVLIDGGQRCDPETYPLGEIEENYARSALCQKGKLHYILVTANTEGIYQNVPTIADFTRNLMTFGVDKAYALDGGQTAVIAMNDQLINKVVYGYQRKISDIIYFATAVPETP